MPGKTVVQLHPEMQTREELNLHKRLDHQIHLLLEEVEEDPERFGFKERLSMVTTIGMYLTRDIKITAAENESKPSGSSVRKYQSAFRTNVVGTRKGGARSAPATSPADTSDPEFSE